MIDRAFATRLRRVDPEALGAKLKAARVGAGLSQSEVAAGEVTISFISRIESGKRRADPSLIVRIAERLGIDLDQLLSEDPTIDDSPVAHLIQFAEVALEMGDPRAALSHLAGIPDEPGALSRTSRIRAGVLEARAHEALGDRPRAIALLEPLMERATEPGTRIALAIALSRCYRDSGELVRAVRVGEDVLDSLADSGLLGGDEAVQLTVTIATSYFEQGDRGYAVRLGRRAVAAAEEFGSPHARAAAYWQTGQMEFDRGDIPSAVAMAQRALSLLADGRDARNLARLRTELGRMELELDPPALDEALAHLRDAGAHLDTPSGEPADRLRNRLALARADLIRGDPTSARDESDRVEAESGTEPLLRTAADLLSAQALMALDDREGARARLLAAASGLSAYDGRTERGIGQLWMDLGALLEAVGETASAADAYRRAAATTGLDAGRTAPVTV